MKLTRTSQNSLHCGENYHGRINGKDDTVVEYALSRSLSPTLVADYQTQLPNKNILQRKWTEILESLNIKDADDF